MGENPNESHAVRDLSEKPTPVTCRVNKSLHSEPCLCVLSQFTGTLCAAVREECGVAPWCLHRFAEKGFNAKCQHPRPIVNKLAYTGLHPPMSNLYYFIVLPWLCLRTMLKYVYLPPFAPMVDFCSSVALFSVRIFYVTPTTAILNIQYGLFACSRWGCGTARDYRFLGFLGKRRDNLKLFKGCQDQDWLRFVCFD